jgi:hypothetical protein
MNWLEGLVLGLFGAMLALMQASKPLQLMEPMTETFLVAWKSSKRMRSGYPAYMEVWTN